MLRRQSFLRTVGILFVIVVVGSAIAILSFQDFTRNGRVPEGFVMANGRIEVERVDVATKYAGRVDEITIREGDMVEAGSIVARLGTEELKSQLAASEALVRSARQSIARAEAEVALRRAEHKLSELELARVEDLEEKSIATKADLDRRVAQHAIAEANLLGAQASVGSAKAAVDQAEAQSAQIRVMIAEMTLRAPIDGRIEYKLVQPGAVIGAGARVATILDLSDVYMSVFLPTSQAGVLAQDAEARIVLDAAPGYVIPATVSFVASEAQFTPKMVETANEREKLMYRVKLQIAPEVLIRFQDYVKAGYTGDAYLRLNPDLDWPPELVTRLPDAP
ncbi:MAG: HlyD family efflux transporter periplasmic adaptor subunit [Paracoccaceae bacterium]